VCNGGLAGRMSTSVIEDPPAGLPAGFDHTQRRRHPCITDGLKRRALTVLRCGLSSAGRTRAQPVPR
jgi:hypothetical protein